MVDKMKVLHVGASDAIGRQVAKSAFADVISHNQIENTNFSNYDAISISAFDPKRKLSLVDGPTLIDKLAQICPSHGIKMVYYSTCRVFDPVTSDNHRHYVANKLEDENVLRDSFDDVSTIYFPIIVPCFYKDNSPFFKTLFNNLKKNTVRFDFSRKSEWNFVLSSELIKLTADLFQLGNKQVVLSKTPTSIGDLVDYLSKNHKNLEIQHSEAVKNYPTLDACPIIHTEIDTGYDLVWLSKLERIVCGK